MAKAKLSVILERLGGKAGGVEFVNSRTGLTIRARTYPKDPETPAQLQMRAFMANTARVWNELTPAQVEAWRTYATSLASKNGQSRPIPYNAFLALANKYQQIQAYLQNSALPRESDIPSWPPTAPFEGDALTFQVEVLGENIVFIPIGSPTPGVLTEILIQLLPSRNRQPVPNRYRTKAFVDFSQTPHYALPVSPGSYAIAYRFANAATGQETPLNPLTIVFVE